VTPRPYLRSTIVELEELFAAKRTDSDTLNVLKTELQFRNVPRATALLAKVKAALSGDTSLIPTAQPGLFAAGVQPEPPPPQQAATVILPRPIPRPAEKMPEVPAMPLDEAYKLLRVTAGRPWDEVEQARVRIVQRSHPDALEGLSAEKRAAALSEAKRANAAYAALAKERGHNL
jgi:hypothetical protein